MTSRTEGDGGRTAGRELDAEVAARVMGYTLLTEAEMRAEAERVWREQPACRVFLLGFTARDVEGAWKFANDLPRYSSGIEAAWLVVEKMRARGFDVTALTFAHRPHISKHYACEIARPEWADSEYEDADSLPLAICLAALAASSLSEGKP